MISHEYHGVSNHQQLNWLFNSLFRPSVKLHILGPLWGKPPVTSGFPSQMASNAESVTVSCCHHLTHWGRATHLCVSNLTIIGSDNGLSPDRRQAIIWTNAGILSIRPLGTNFSEILTRNNIFSFKKMHLKILSGKSQPFCLGVNVIMGCCQLAENSVSKTILTCKWQNPIGWPDNGLKL